MTWAGWLLSMVGPLLARILASLGLSLVSMTGLSLAVSALKAALTGSLGGLPSAGLMLGGLFGLWECLGIILGGITFVMTWNATAGFWRLAKV